MVQIKQSRSPKQIPASGCHTIYLSILSIRTNACWRLEWSIILASHCSRVFVNSLLDLFFFFFLFSTSKHQNDDDA